MKAVEKRAFLGTKGLTSVSTFVDKDSWDDKIYISANISSGFDQAGISGRKEITKLITVLQAALDVTFEEEVA